MVADTTKLAAENRRKQRAFDDLNETYFTLAGKSTSTMAKQAEQKNQGMQDMAKAFNRSGAELYHSTDSKVELP